MCIFSDHAANNMVGGVSVKKNELTEKHYEKGSKGFYAALGISAVMIGAACLFAHKQGDRLPQVKPSSENNTIVHEAAVDRYVTNIPKSTAPAYRVTTTAASAVMTGTVQSTVPAAEITVDAPFKENSYSEQPEPAAAIFTAARPPLDDMSSILCEFSGGELVKNTTTGTWQTHNGTDIAAEVGTDVYAPAAGEIKKISNDPLWGVTVTIDHLNGYTTKYCGLGSDLAVKQGDKVNGGDLVGAVGETADIESGTPPHLHVEFIHNGEFIDPMSMLAS